MNRKEITAKKRDGKTLTESEIKAFIEGVTSGDWEDYQTAAFLMACFIRGLNANEQTALTQAMLESGNVLDFSDIEKPKADKHSTGGVGDKTSLIIAPLAAACGLAVPMISGRGLGHTGGTLDKLESIKGYSVNLTLKNFRQVINKCGFSMIGQTKEIAPADKKIYALRDATATVNSIPLIVASIMSKKLAEGLDVLVLDVKTGNGAFMQSFGESKKLARALVETGKSCGVKTEALISDMSQPLGKFVGNALEIYECVKILRGEADELMQPTLDLSFALTARMLILSGLAENKESARHLLEKALKSGEALDKFRQNVKLQKGDTEICDSPEKLIAGNLRKIEIKAEATGFISEINTLKIGEIIVEIGGGRMKIEDKIDYAVGYECRKKISEAVSQGEILGFLHLRKGKDYSAIERKITSAYKITETKVKEKTLIKSIIS